MVVVKAFNSRSFLKKFTRSLWAYFIDHSRRCLAKLKNQIADDASDSLKKLRSRNNGASRLKPYTFGRCHRHYYSITSDTYVPSGGFTRVTRNDEAGRRFKIVPAGKRRESKKTPKSKMDKLPWDDCIEREKNKVALRKDCYWSFVTFSTSNTAVGPRNYVASIRKVTWIYRWEPIWRASQMSLSKILLNSFRARYFLLLRQSLVL